MNDGTAAIIFLLVVLALLIWLLFVGPRAREARVERERRAAEEAERRAAELSRLQEDREALLKEIRGQAPDFILQARLEFERNFRAGGVDGFFGQEMSPLVCFGYRVGRTNGRTTAERHAILEYALAADLDKSLPFLPAEYRSEWGGPLSIRRFKRIYAHLNSMADLRDGRRNFETAVTHWRTDAAWFHSDKRDTVDRFREISA